MNAQELQVGLLASDLGRLRKHLAPIVENFDNTYTAHMIERLSGTVEVLDSMLHPTAAELVQDGLSVEEALAQVDLRRAALLRTLGQHERAKDYDGTPGSVFLSTRPRWSAS